MKARLRLTLLTAALPGGGEGRAVALDRDVVSDSFGLPRVPARRVKGLLLEAAREIEESLQIEHHWSIDDIAGWVDPSGLLGRPGRGRAEVGFTLDDFTLDGYAELASWLRWARHEHPLIFTRESVLRAYTEERGQTAIDADTGAPAQETLRRSRLIRCGHELFAPVVLPRVAPAGTTAEALQHPHYRTLALACAGVKRLGQSRNRGTGRVRLRCELAEDPPVPDEPPQWQDATQAAIQLLATELARGTP